jgi:D-amino peptidase
MKVYISADGEGISGMVSTQEMHETGADYTRFRHLMTEDVNAAIRGAYDGGATEVVVNDSHWSSLNLLFEEIDPRADVIRGFNKDLCMVEQIEGFDAAFFVGYHAKVGTSDGVANETMIGFEMYEVRMNGQTVGELEINAAIAGHFGVPIVMVSGDDCLAEEARAALPGVETAVVKYAIDRWSARCLSLPRAHDAIAGAARRAVEHLDAARPFRLEGPVEIEIEWTSTAECKKAALVPGSVRRSPRTIAYRGEDILKAWQGTFACLNLGWSASNPIYG